MSPRHDDRAVSSVVSAVLLFALFTSASALYVFNTLPDRIEGREANNQAQVREAFTALKAGLDALSASNDAGPVSVSIPLAAKPVPLLQQASGSGSLAVQADAFAVSAAWPGGTRAHLLDGQAVGAPSATLPATMSNVTELLSLVLGMATTGVTTGANATLQAAATAGATTVTASVRHTASAAGICANGPSILYTLAVTGQVDRTQTLACGVTAAIGSTNDPYRIDLRQDTLGFLAALQRLPTPLNISLSTATTGGAALTGRFAAVWFDGDGLLRRAGDGESYTTPLQLTSDVLRYSPSVFQFVRQELSWQGGAVVANQSATDQAVVSPPGLRLAGSSLTLTLVDLDGVGSLSGTGTATATVTHVGTSEQVLVVPAGTNLTVTTSEPTAWASLLNQTRLLAGLTPAQFGIASGSNSVTVTLGAFDWTLHLRLVQARVVVT